MIKISTNGNMESISIYEEPLLFYKNALFIL